MGRIVLRLDRMMVERGRSLNWLADRVGITNVNLSKIKNNHVTAIRFSPRSARPWTANPATSSTTWRTTLPSAPDSDAT